MQLNTCKELFITVIVTSINSNAVAHNVAICEYISNTRKDGSNYLNVKSVELVIMTKEQNEYNWPEITHVIHTGLIWGGSEDNDQV